MEQKARNLAALLKVLANENRLLLLCRLLHGSMTVSALGETLPRISPSALSQHLALLKAHCIVESVKTGRA